MSCEQLFGREKLSVLFLSQLICTVTPSSSNSEETHNTLKFAHRAKHIEIQASQNKVCTSEFMTAYM